jgi:hypothetical protein
MPPEAVPLSSIILLRLKSATCLLRSTQHTGREGDGGRGWGWEQPCREIPRIHSASRQIQQPVSGVQEQAGRQAAP